MQSWVMMALGAYRFSMWTGGFQQTERETAWRWAPQEVIGAYPQLQYIGPGLDHMAIRGVIHPHYRGGLGQVEAMRAQAGRGRPLNLIDGTGRYYGQWVIDKIGEGKSGFLPDSAARRIEFTVELTKYA